MPRSKLVFEKILLERAEADHEVATHKRARPFAVPNRLSARIVQSQAGPHKRRHAGGVQLVRMPVLGLHHAGLYVANLGHSIAFYQTVFGLELAERFALGGEDI